MQAYDFIVLALLVIAAIWGARRGFVKQLASLLSIVLGYIVAVNFRETVAPMVDAPHPWNHFAAMLGLFMVTSLVIWIGFRFVNGTIEKAGLTSFDAQIGGLFGLVKGGLLVMAVTMFAVVLLGDGQRDFVLGSYSGNKICRLIHRTQSLVPTEWQQAMEPYLRTVEEHSNIAGQPVDKLDQAIDGMLSADPFATDSPSDASAVAGQRSSYEDPNFGIAPRVTVPVSQNPPFQSRFGQWQQTQASEQTPQARLQEPVFGR